MRRAFVVLAAMCVLSAPRTASACAWDDETFHAEGESLPCVHDAILGTYAQHAREFYDARIAAADAVLEWDPRETRALDRKGVALLKLRRFDEAERVMKARLAVTPDAYAAHANLGTLYTFTGQLERAIEHIDRAMAIEPKAHFGREKFHRLLVVYLQDLAAGRVKDTENFLRVAVTDADRAAGKDVLAERKVAPDAFDALVSMITVYGAQDVPHVYLALGDLLSLRGARRLAWAAYERARELKHPSAKAIAGWQDVIEAPIKEEQKARAEKMRVRIPGEPPEPAPIRGSLRDAYKSRKQTPGNATDMATSVAAEDASRYTAWEKKQIAAGLAVWTDDGLAKLYQEAQRRMPRCKSPGVVEDAKIAP